MCVVLRITLSTHYEHKTRASDLKQLRPMERGNSYNHRRLFESISDVPPAENE